MDFATGQNTGMNTPQFNNAQGLNYQPTAY